MTLAWIWTQAGLPAATTWLSVGPSPTRAPLAAPISTITARRTQVQGTSGLLAALGAVGIGASSAFAGQRRFSRRTQRHSRTGTASSQGRTTEVNEKPKFASAALVTSLKIQCEHPDREPPYLCGDCPRNAAYSSAEAKLKGNSTDEPKFASAALVTSLKIQCEHPDREPPYLCGDCPRNAAHNCAEVNFEDEVYRVTGDSKFASAALVTSFKIQCEHPDREPPYLCGDCPRN